MARQIYSSSMTIEAQRGRTLTIRETYKELSPFARAKVDALCDWLVAWVKKRNPKALFSHESALEVVWQFLVFEDDPNGHLENARLNAYEQHFLEKRMLEERMEAQVEP